jgi:RNA polymerase sigma-70 factor (ECF subfamily)
MQDNMMNFAMILTSNKEDAKDLLQDTALKVLDNRHKFVDNINFKGWVLTVMRNIFINHYHKVVRTQVLIDQDVDVYNLDVLNESRLDSPENMFQIQEIAGAIERLNDELRCPFSMYVSGYKYCEISEKLGIPLGTVKSRIFFARQELQKILKDS